MCPRCRSNSLKVKHRAGLERLKILFTGMRKYRCAECGTVFRAVDRRKRSRDNPAVVSVSPPRQVL